MIIFILGPVILPTDTVSVSVSVSTQTTGLSFLWDPTHCDANGDGGHQFVYELSYKDGANISTGRITSTNVTFDMLNPCTDYQFHVLVANSIGLGPSSNVVLASTRTVGTY